jgi:hypothetical protein
VTGYAGIKKGGRMDIIKCGRKTYELEKGDMVMDNGACYQLISREVRNGFRHISPKLSKTAFSKFIKIERTQIKKDHGYGASIIIWEYL